MSQYDRWNANIRLFVFVALLGIFVLTMIAVMAGNDPGIFGVILFGAVFVAAKTLNGWIPRPPSSY